jgi:hypothetical protein
MGIVPDRSEEPFLLEQSVVLGMAHVDAVELGVVYGKTILCWG